MPFLLAHIDRDRQFARAPLFQQPVLLFTLGPFCGIAIFYGLEAGKRILDRHASLRVLFIQHEVLRRVALHGIPQ